MSISTTTTTYKEVQMAFRKLALRHHPDTASSRQHGDDTDHNGRMMSYSFTEIREAFEAIIEGPNGEAILRKNDDYTSSFQHNAQYRDNDKEDNNNEMDINSNNNNRPPPHDSDMFHSSLNPQILREVAQVAEEMNPGGLDKGGMWQYANMVNRMAKEEGLPPLRVGNGGDADKGDRSRSGVARRRRKRK